MPYRTKALEILELWRDAERKHSASADASERALLRTEMDTL